jgi:hypothetical protein
MWGYMYNWLSPSIDALLASLDRYLLCEAASDPVALVGQFGRMSLYGLIIPWDG